MDGDYEGTKRIQYEGGATFVPVCSVCSRFVEADVVVAVNDRQKANATCSKCGRTTMVFEGYLDEP